MKKCYVIKVVFIGDEIYKAVTCETIYLHKTTAEKIAERMLQEFSNIYSSVYVAEFDLDDFNI